MLRVAILTLLFAIGLANPSAAVAAPEDLCISLLQGDVRDVFTSYSEAETYSRYQSVLQRARLRTYQELESMQGSLGVDIPIAKGLIGLTAEAERDSARFQQEMDRFFRSSYSEYRQRVVNAVQTSEINAQLLRVVQNCHDRYFSRIGLETLVDLNGYDSFTVVIRARPDETTPLILRQIEPARQVTCTENRAPVRLNVARSNLTAILDCSKSPDREVHLAISTNLGSSSRIRLPARPATAAAIQPAVVELDFWIEGEIQDDEVSPTFTRRYPDGGGGYIFDPRETTHCVDDSMAIDMTRSFEIGRENSVLQVVEVGPWTFPSFRVNSARPLPDRKNCIQFTYQLIMLRPGITIGSTSHPPVPLFADARLRVWARGWRQRRFADAPPVGRASLPYSVTLALPDLTWPTRNAVPRYRAVIAYADQPDQPSVATVTDSDPADGPFVAALLPEGSGRWTLLVQRRQ